MKIVLDRLALVLASEPAVVSQGSVSTMQPALGSDMPSCTVGLDLLEDRGRGLGRIVRAGHGITRNLQVVSVQASGSFETSSFDPDLVRFKLWPLPIRRNPDTSRGPIGPHDVSVTNMTTGVPYSYASAPSGPSEFDLDPEAGILRFGAPQVPGHQLEIEHWMVAWREDIQAERYQGEMILNVWGADFATVEDISGRVMERLQRSHRLLKTYGFDSLSGSYLGFAQSDVFNPLAGSSFSRWRQEFRYRFSFDTELGGESSSGGVIRRIDVNIDGKLPDPFSITQ